MADYSTINDYSMIDNFLNQNIQNYRRQLFGDYDPKTGYYSKQNIDEEPSNEQSLSEDYDQLETDPMDELQEFEDQDMYDFMFGDSNFQQNSDEDDFYDFSSVATGDGEDEDDKNPKSLASQISDKESQGKYTATNPNSTATGKYQFLWSSWGDSIKKVTGVKDQKAFLNNPAAQEKYYSHYEKTYLLPEVKKIRKEIKTDLTDTQLAKLVHFRGEGGARKYLKGEAKDKPESYNMSTSQYIKQTGGGIQIANTDEEQYIGLNNDQLDELILPLSGTNTIRGLDSGIPVLVQDETGRKKILKGRNHTTRMKGRIFERKLK